MLPNICMSVMFSFSQLTLANNFSSNVSPTVKLKHESNGLVAFMEGLKNVNSFSYTTLNNFFKRKRAFTSQHNFYLLLGH